MYNFKLYDENLHSILFQIGNMKEYCMRAFKLSIYGVLMNYLNTVYEFVVHYFNKHIVII